MDRARIPAMPSPALYGEDAGEEEAVVTFGADGLESGGRDVGGSGDEIDEAADALDGGVGGVGVEDGAPADDVVGDDEGAGVGELEGP